MVKKNYVQNRTKDPKENTKKSAEEEILATMNFMVAKSLRNAFKAKVSSQGKTIKDVLIEFMEGYIKK